jgi:hypothetical protein
MSTLTVGGIAAASFSQQYRDKRRWPSLAVTFAHSHVHVEILPKNPGTKTSWSSSKQPPSPYRASNPSPRLTSQRHRCSVNATNRCRFLTITLACQPRRMLSQSRDRTPLIAGPSSPGIRAVSAPHPRREEASQQSRGP